MRTTVLGVIVVAGALLASACSPASLGAPVPAAPPPITSPSTASGPGAAENWGAPRVTKPLDVAKYLPNPCAALKPSQLKSLGLPQEGLLDNSNLGNICSWGLRSDTTYDLGFNVAFSEGDPPGLANAYKVAGASAMRRLSDIYGVPAATEPGQNTNGSCTIYLGATDTIEYAAAVVIGFGAPHYQNPCSAAHQLAMYATATMRSGR
ncbi:MAG TPA: DUF3558 domain-containing protein [Pseudonocardiaceae bacterium]|jgi:hypothetical protein|nr:DUF3558 domain-containing protein [Pseudonocardiaceae bacterium]